MKKLLILLFVPIFFTAGGCGQRIAGNPGKFSYEEYSNYSDYRKKQLEESESKAVNPQTTLSNPTLIGDTGRDFNKILPRQAAEYFTAKQYCRACITRGIGCALIPVASYGAAAAVTRRYKSGRTRERNTN